MSTALLKGQNYFGLFELDSSGTVLYCRVEPDGRSDRKGPDVTGRDFFRDVMPFENKEELRQRLAEFSRSSVRADNFIFHGRIESALLAVKILLARIGERADGNRTKSVLLHIRKYSP